MSRQSKIPSRSHRFRVSCGQLMLLGSSWLIAAEAAGAETLGEHPGAKIYQKMCADCHGAKGEGVAEKYDDPLVGNRSISALTKYISRTMPDGKEGTCVGEDAVNVAAYIFDAFYSPAAQARNNPVRESLRSIRIRWPICWGACVAIRIVRSAASAG